MAKGKTEFCVVFNDFILALSSLERAARAIGYNKTALTLHEAINIAGWERVAELEKSLAALEQKEPPKEPMPAKAKGGKARAESLSPERRTEIAASAANKRWNNSPPPPPNTGSIVKKGI